MSAFSFIFSPNPLSVAARTAVTFRNDDDFEHQIRISEAGGGTEAERTSPRLGAGQTWTFAPGTPGDVDYFCAIHNTMRARLVVT